MNRIICFLVALATVAGVVALKTPARHADGEAAPIYGVTIPPG
jgi:hypothetical protein